MVKRKTTRRRSRLMKAFVREDAKLVGNKDHKKLVLLKSQMATAKPTQQRRPR